MSRIYRYILVHDHGIAPCADDRLLSLATCKPAIRRKAVEGDWVLGFRPGSLHRGLLLWGGRVQAVVPHGEYERSHRGRRDALYRERPDGSFDRVDPAYHPGEDEMARDLSGPVLIFDPSVSRYLDGFPITLPDDLMHLAAAGRGHLVNGSRSGDAARLAALLVKLGDGGGTGRSASADVARRSCGPIARE